MSDKKEMILYEYSKCGTCRSAFKDLEAAGRSVRRIPLFETPPSKEELRSLVKKSGLELKKFFNTSGEVYKELGLKDKLGTMSEEEQLELLSSNGRLIKRPIATDGVRVTVGFKPESYKAAWHG
ncbi:MULTISPECIES: arsenate reductase family protein [unclassified Paenibacillus]|uniref:arsenate reductase family protein n=1 Tax=unclassified Paenibacillus TaxID=185978 RepID=UPI0009561899|nr:MULTISPECIES: arsenate reductase family protein [unclassified Paenibacillus]ASS68942.1 arsenate reductase family protein [Paenibacillus sp. RUD330]SIR13923.1 arsenate reductase [Paenibacillus sp. RU4X]SIR23870.1 arsenate reductase [Paenibacillus sp. RU4T]